MKGTHSRWYRAEDHFADLTAYAQGLNTRIDKVYHALDVFGASERVSNTWIKHGYSSTSFDIKLSSKHDVVSETGVKLLLQMGVQRLAFCWYFSFMNN
jgi:hypothetical protein